MNLRFLSIILVVFSGLIIVACGGNDKPKKENSIKVSDKKAASTKSTAVAKADMNNEVDEEQTKPKDPTPPEHIAKAKEIIAAVASADVDAVDALAKYKTYCALCHGFKGNANINGATDLTKSKISLEESVAQVYHGKGLMTPFKGILKDAEIVAVANYIETLRK